MVRSAREHLLSNKLSVQATFEHQLLVRAAVDYPSFIHNKDGIRVANGGEAMGYDDDRLAHLNEIVDCLPDQVLGQGIQVRGNLN